MRNNLNSKLGVAALVAAMSVSCGGDEAAGERGGSDSGPGVRSAQLKVSGAVNGEFLPVDVGEAYITGDCNPEIFANFGIVFDSDIGSGKEQQVRVTFMTKDRVAPGQVGAVELDWVWITFTDDQYNTTEYRGPGELVITEHDAGAPRLAGTMQGSIPGFSGIFDGSQTLSDRTIDAEFSFDLNAACGAFQR